MEIHVAKRSVYFRRTHVNYSLRLTKQKQFRPENLKPIDLKTCNLSYAKVFFTRAFCIFQALRTYFVSFTGDQ